MLYSLFSVVMVQLIFMIGGCVHFRRELMSSRQPDLFADRGDSQRSFLSLSQDL